MVRHLITLTAAVVLAGCAGLQRVDSTVQSFARWDTPTGSTPSAPGKVPAAPQRYRFERLPSQRDGSATGGQAQLEAMTRNALESRGWTLATADTEARWVVQVSASTVRAARDPWDDPWGGWRFHSHIVAGNGHVFFSPMFAFPPDPPGYRRQVSLLVRDTGSGRVVYETRADHESRWNSAPELWQAMVEAALRDFPAPPDGPRQVTIDLPR